jgi:hypothetical protein
MVLSQPACTFLKPDLTTVPVQRIFLKKNSGSKAPQGVVKNFPFRVKVADATLWSIVVGARQIKYYEPLDRSAVRPPLYLPSIDQVQEALAIVPQAILNTTIRVIAHPTPNPDDAAEARRLGIKKFRANAASHDATIDIYPFIRPPTQALVDDLILHECIHNFVREWLGSPVNRQRWSEAMTADGNFPSLYAKQQSQSKARDVHDDLAEFLLIYLQAKGSICETDARSLFRRRFALIDDSFKLK